MALALITRSQSTCNPFNISETRFSVPHFGHDGERGKMKNCLGFQRMLAHKALPFRYILENARVVISLSMTYTIIDSIKNRKLGKFN